MKLLYFNARSICNKQSELSDFLAFHQCDIIGICETWLKNSVSLTAFDTDYHVFRNDRPDAVGNGGGTLLAVKSNLHCKLVDKIVTNKCECIFVDVKFNKCDYVRYGLVYRPPDTNLEDSKALFKLIYDHLKNSKMYILLGDFNLPDISWPSLTARSNISREFLTLCFRIGAEQCVDFPTRKDNILDLVLCSSKVLLNYIQCKPPFSTSDHDTILCHLANHLCDTQVDAVKPCFKKADYAVINAFLSTIDWDEVYSNCVTTQEYWNSFKDVINTAIYNFVPFVAPVRRKHSPWFNESLRKLHKAKNRNWKKYNRSRNVVTYSEYKSSANKFRAEFLKSKCMFEKNLFRSDNSKGKFYGYIKSQTTVNQSIPSIKKNDGSLVFTDQEKAHEFINYFSSVSTMDNNVLPEFAPQCNGSLENFSCNVRDVIKVVMKLRNSSSAGPDGINVFFIKKILAEIANPLCKIYNVSLSQGTLPDDWKIAHVIPVFKKGDTQNASHYRPISLTSVICKILERIVRSKLLDYAINNNIIPKEQHGFVPRKSTVSNLLECFNEWSLNFDKGLPTNVIYLDFSKCFDSVCHSKLLFKLSKYGIGGSAHKWLESFLLNRVQSVKINNSLSSAAKVVSGVPQGTVLGPILFVLYSADIPNVVSNSKMSIYADDSKVYKAIRDVNDCKQLQKDLDKLSVWAEKWQLSLNPDKTKMLYIGNQNVSVDYTLCGRNIEKVDHMNDVGVIVQSNLKFTMHCTNTVRKANYVIHKIFTTFRNHDADFYRKMYISYVRPILEYASQVWSPVMKCNIDRIERVQRYYSRRILSHNLLYPDRLNILNLQTLEERRIQADIVLFYKLAASLTVIDVSNCYSFVNSHRGHSRHLYMYYSRTDKRKFFWINRIVSYWNNLENETVTCPNIARFKKIVKKVTFIGRGSFYC